MKRIALILFSLAVVAYAIGRELARNTEEDTSSAGKAVFSWAATTFDFGKVKAGVPVTHEFSFTNTGDIPLVISTVRASCGCTVTDYSKEPIGPSSKGFVKATYNAARTGQFTKTISVNANTEEGLVQLTIKGEVVE